MQRRLLVFFDGSIGKNHSSKRKLWIEIWWLSILQGKLRCSSLFEKQRRRHVPNRYCSFSHWSVMTSINYVWVLALDLHPHVLIKTWMMIWSAFLAHKNNCCCWYFAAMRDELSWIKNSRSYFKYRFSMQQRLMRINIVTFANGLQIFAWCNAAVYCCLSGLALGYWQRYQNSRKNLLKH